MSRKHPPALKSLVLALSFVSLSISVTSASAIMGKRGARRRSESIPHRLLQWSRTRIDNIGDRLASSGTTQRGGDVLMHDDPAVRSLFEHHRPAPVQMRCRPLLIFQITPKRHHPPPHRPPPTHPHAV